MSPVGEVIVPVQVQQVDNLLKFEFQPNVLLSCTEGGCKGKMVIFKGTQLGSDLDVESDGGVDRALAWSVPGLEGCPCGNGVPQLRNRELSMLASTDEWNQEVTSFASQKLVESLMTDFQAEKGGRMRTEELGNFQRLAREYAEEKFGDCVPDYSSRMSFEGCCQSPDRCEECRGVEGNTA